jgi:hypothetical protein
MKSFSIVPRGKKFWVEETNEEGATRTVVGFPTEDAAVRCLRDLQRHEEREQDG